MTIQFRRAAAALTVPAALALTLTACGGGGGGGRPSVDDMSSHIMKISDGHLTQTQADCVAKLYVNSDLSDGILNKIMDANSEDDLDKLDDKDISSADNKAAESIVDDLDKCVS